MSQGTTLAFSTKNKAWTTRYSFTPTQYAHIDDEFLSCDNLRSINNLIWEHERGTDYNSFYGTTYGTYVSVSSNQDPSKEKIFKAVSLETNEGNWSSILITNDDAEGDIYFKIQQSFIPSFVSKEGNKYAYVPPSARNSTRNINFLGLVNNSEQGPSNVLNNFAAWQVSLENVVNDYISAYQDDQNASEEFLLSLSPYVNPSQVTNLNQKSRFAYLQAAGPAYEIRTFYMIDGAVEDSDLQGSIVSATYNQAVSLNRIPVFIEANPSARVFFDFKMILEFLLSANNISYEEFSEYTYQESLPIRGHMIGQITSAAQQFNPQDADTSSTTVPFYSISEPSIDGDSMRGKYMTISLFLENPSQPMELYAINTEYIESKLDSSFNQNS